MTKEGEMSVLNEIEPSSPESRRVVFRLAVNVMIGLGLTCAVFSAQGFLVPLRLVLSIFTDTDAPFAFISLPLAVVTMTLSFIAVCSPQRRILVGLAHGALVLCCPSVSPYRE